MRRPHGKLNKHLDYTKHAYNVISCSVINITVLLHWFSLIVEDDESSLMPNENNSENRYCNRQKIGRPLGSSIVAKHETDLRRVKIHNDISITYYLEKMSLTHEHGLPNIRLEYIIYGITSKHGIYYSVI